MDSNTFGSIWDAIEETPQDAALMKLRSVLLLALQRRIERSGWTTEKAAKNLAVPLGTAMDVMGGEIDALTLDVLVTMAVTSGIDVSIVLSEPR